MQRLASAFGVSVSTEKKGYDKRSKRSQREARDFYLFVAPWLLGFVGLSLVPLILGLMLSFTNYDGFNIDYVKFMGFKNYTRAFANEDFWLSFKNTIIFALIAVPLGSLFGMGLAVMLNQQIRGRPFYRMIYYLPSILPLAGAILAWQLMFNKNTGLVNAILSWFQPGTAVNWQHDYFFMLLYMFGFWGVGGSMILYLAGLQGIPGELYEAAKIDGANRFQIFWKITLPLLTPVIFFQVVLGMIGTLQIFDAVVLLWGRTGLSGAITMPHDKYMYMVYTYAQVFDFQRFGYGTALSWIFFVVLLLLTLILVGSSKYWVYYEVSTDGGEA